MSSFFARGTGIFIPRAIECRQTYLLRLLGQGVRHGVGRSDSGCVRHVLFAAEAKRRPDPPDDFVILREQGKKFADGEACVRFPYSTGYGESASKPGSGPHCRAL